MGKMCKSKDPTWTPSKDVSTSFDTSFEAEELYDDSSSDDSFSSLEYDYQSYESVLDHQNSIYCANPYTDLFGIFGKNLAQFKTVLEKPVEFIDDCDDSTPYIPIENYLEVVLKEESPIKSCLKVEEIPEEIPVESTNEVPSPVVEQPISPLLLQTAPIASSTPKSTPFTNEVPNPVEQPMSPLLLQTAPIASSTPKSTPFKVSLRKHNTSITDYFKPISKTHETGSTGKLKRKRTDEMEKENHLEENPAKRALVIV